MDPPCWTRHFSKQERQENPQPHLEPFFDICDRLLGNVRHIGIHNGGEIISDVPLSRRLPTEPATMPDRTVVQWDKEGLEDAGIIKIDVLGLRMLAAITGNGRAHRHRCRGRPL